MDIQEQKKTWSNFTKLISWVSAGVITILALMVTFLL